MENENVDILELFRTNPAKAWEIVHSRPRHHINKEEFFKELMRKKELLENVENKNEDKKEDNNEDKNEAA
ncbi:MAG TPA: hypothetical protein VFE50_19465 [Cyclobacteriaceae bacterium]|nr:hypothetical protein [Cyclobacteriaceae bacterium]